MSPTPATPATVLVVIGTRPEAIKMAPVVHALTKRSDRFRVVVCSTGQHRELLGRTLMMVNVRADMDLNVMVHDQSLSGLTARLLDALDPVVGLTKPEWLLVQGDTTTATVGALVGFYRRVRIGHVEAGLRTGDLHQPFPEEFNRRVADMCADLCFAPTTLAREQLLAEHIPPARIHVTGNTIVDAVLEIARRPYDEHTGPLASVPRDRRWVLVTTHRRENFGAPLERICTAVDHLARQYGDSTQFIVPVHPNPNVSALVLARLTAPNCSVLPALDYPDFIHALTRSTLVLSDSGGVQEEAPSFGVPVLVLRDKTERPEGVAAGVTRLVGTNTDTIVQAATELLSAGATRTSTANPYGDGTAAAKIVSILEQRS